MSSSAASPMMRLLDVGGDGSEPPVVLLHGLTFDSSTWAPVIASLTSRSPDRRIIAVDLPGHGRTPSCLPHDLQRMVRLLHDTLHAAGVDEPVVVGHSMSGVLATLYGAQYPTAAVVNVDQPLDIASFAGLLRQVWPRLAGPEFLSMWQGVFAASFHLETLPAKVRELIQSTSRPHRDVVLSYWRQLVDRPAEEMHALLDDALTTLAADGTPYLLLLGDERPAQVTRHLTDRAPHAEILHWAGSGHFPHLAKPEAFADLVAGMRRHRTFATTAEEIA